MMTTETMMFDRRELMALGAMGAVALALFGWSGRGGAAARGKFEVNFPDAVWRKKLRPAAYAVLRQEATEEPGSSPLLNEHRAGRFLCGACVLPAFSSTTKFDSGTGWPSFWQPLPNAVKTSSDTLLGYQRTEVHCRRCGSHLGHVFDDGPKPTGLRYCMNGVALTFAAGGAA